jgi:hypothetical protein
MFRYPTTQSVGRVALTPLYGLGSAARTGPAVLISSPRNKIGSCGRIYNWANPRGQGEAFKLYLLKTLGPGRKSYNLNSIIET